MELKFVDSNGKIHCNTLLLYYHEVLTTYVDLKLYMTHIKVKCIQTSENG
jgi:hypothetical protein